MPRILRRTTRGARSSARALTAGLFVLLACLFASGHAAAQNQLSIDAEAAFPSDESHDTGWGGGVRFGHEWDLVLVSLTPEIGANYHAFGGAPDAEAFAVVAGGRVGIGFVLEPSAFLHAGVGHFGYDTVAGDVSQTSLAYEMGLALDLTLLPVIDIGAHASFAGVAGDDDLDSFNWFAVGGHLTFVFDGKERD